MTLVFFKDEIRNALTGNRQQFAAANPRAARAMKLRQIRESQEARQVKEAVDVNVTAEITADEQGLITVMNKRITSSERRRNQRLKQAIDK